MGGGWGARALATPRRGAAARAPGRRHRACPTWKPAAGWWLRALLFWPSCGLPPPPSNQHHEDQHVNLLITLIAVVLFSFSCFCISRMTQTSKRRLGSSRLFSGPGASGLQDALERPCWRKGRRCALMAVSRLYIRPLDGPATDTTTPVNALAVKL